jgi:hypothetical protein
MQGQMSMPQPLANVEGLHYKLRQGWVEVRLYICCWKKVQTSMPELLSVDGIVALNARDMG